MEGSLPCLKFLVAEGDNPAQILGARNDNGETPKMLSQQFYKDSVAEYISNLEWERDHPEEAESEYGKVLGMDGFFYRKQPYLDGISLGTLSVPAFVRLSLSSRFAFAPWSLCIWISLSIYLALCISLSISLSLSLPFLSLSLSLSLYLSLSPSLYLLSLSPSLSLLSLYFSLSPSLSLSLFLSLSFSSSPALAACSLGLCLWFSLSIPLSLRNKLPLEKYFSFNIFHD